MKDYANRNFNYSDGVNQQDKVPIHWGFIVAALIVMLVTYSVWRHVQQKSLVHPAVVVAALVTNTAVTNAKAQRVTPAATPAKVTTPPVKFDFYQMLTESPNTKKTVTSVDTSAEANSNSTAITQLKAQTPSQTSTPVTDTETSTSARYYIQVGSYKTKADALQQKANLILSEVSPKLIKVTGSNGHYRVLVGPYSNQESAAAERSDLKQNGIDGSLVNLKK